MRRLLIILPLALLLAACGGTSDESDESASGNVLQTIQISEKEFSLNPNTVTLSQPGTYEFEVTNDGQITHALEIEESGEGAEAESGDIGAGESKTLRFTFSADGSYEMYCPIGNHKDEGMRGTIVVGNAAGGGTTTDDEDETTTNETTTDGDPGY
jgi:plastocyanin